MTTAYNQNQNRSFATALPQQRWFRACLIALVVALGVTYLVQVNTVAARGFEIRTLKSRLETLNHERQELDGRVAELQSFHQVEQLPESSFVAVERVEYLAAIPPSVGVAVR